MSAAAPTSCVAWSDDPHKFADKVLDLTELATYLGEKYGGWWPLAEKYGTKDGRWIGMPIGASGGRVVYRKSWVNEAGYESVPTDPRGLPRALPQAQGERASRRASRSATRSATATPGAPG